MTAKHTPTPWTINPLAGLGVTIRAADGVKPVVEVWANGDDYAANAALIVRAVNVHDDLVAALKQCRDELGSIHYAGDDVDHAEKHSAGFRLANAALAKATSPD